MTRTVTRGGGRRFLSSHRPFRRPDQNITETNIMLKFIRRLAVPAVLCAALAAAGCGGVKEIRLPETGATLEGSITYGRSKVPAALVIVQGPNGSAQGFADDYGHYRIENVPTGEVAVAVNTAAAKGNLM